MPFIAITEKAFARLVNEQYEVLQRGIAVQRRLEQLVLERARARRGRARRCRPRSAARVVMLDGSGDADGVARTSAASCRPRRSTRSAPRSMRAQRTGPAPSRSSPRTTSVAGPRARAAGRRRTPRGGPRAWLVAIRDARRAGRVRAADPAAGGDGRGARADAPAGRARHRAPARRRHPRRGRRRASSTSTSCEARLRPFGVGDQAAVLVFAARRARRARRRRWSGSLAEAGRRRAGRHARGAAVRGRRRVRRRPARARRDARATRWRASTATVRVAASRVGRHRRAAAQLPRGALRARGRPRCSNGRAPEVASWRDLGAFQFLLSVQDDEALRLYCDSVLGPDRERRGRVRRRAAALAGGVPRAQRPVGEGGARALLPPAHAALPDPAHRAAHRARPRRARATASSSGSR